MKRGVDMKGEVGVQMINCWMEIRYLFWMKIIRKMRPERLSKVKIGRGRRPVGIRDIIPGVG